VFVLDADPGTLALARRHTVDYPEIVLVRADASALPLREGAADIAAGALMLHHLTQDEAVVCLALMAAAASLGDREQSVAHARSIDARLARHPDRHRVGGCAS
jgi:hypothetical protein